MSVKATAAQASERWQQAFGAAGNRYKEGVDAVSTAPGQLAAAQKAVYAQRVQESVDLYASRVAAVSLQDWKNAAGTIGVSRLATGATKGAPKMSAFMAKFLPDLKSIVDGLPARGAFDQNLSRFDSYARALHARKGSY